MFVRIVSTGFELVILVRDNLDREIVAAALADADRRAMLAAAQKGETK